MQIGNSAIEYLGSKITTMGSGQSMEIVRNGDWEHQLCWTTDKIVIYSHTAMTLSHVTDSHLKKQADPGLNHKRMVDVNSSRASEPPSASNYEIVMSGDRGRLI